MRTNTDFWVFWSDPRRNYNWQPPFDQTKFRTSTMEVFIWPNRNHLVYFGEKHPKLFHSHQKHISWSIEQKMEINSSLIFQWKQLSKSLNIRRTFLFSRNVSLNKIRKYMQNWRHWQVLCFLPWFNHFENNILWKLWNKKSLFSKKPFFEQWIYSRNGSKLT